MEKTNDDKLSRRAFIRDTSVMTAGVIAGALISEGRALSKRSETAVKKTRSYNPNMEYRRLGKTGLWVSAVCLGGHWKRINHFFDAVDKIDGYFKPKAEADLEGFYRNRDAVVSRCIDAGINLVDACTRAEVEVYSKVLKGRREKMYLACSWGLGEMRDTHCREAGRLLEVLDRGLKRAKQEYADLWRITALEKGGQHTEAETEEMIKALDLAKKQGKCRFTGCSSHDRNWLKMLIEKYPEQIQVVLTPYTADSKVLPKDSLFDAVKKNDVGVLGIKPFANNSLFKGDSSANSPYAEEDDRRARLAIRYILSNPGITAPIPGLVSVHQVENVAQAVMERRELDLAEKAELEKAAGEMWARLGEDYQWLKEWEYV